MSRPSCSPRHRRHCSAYHARLVAEYRDARDALELLRESATLAPAGYGYGAKVSAYQLEPADFDAAYPRVTFREWLEEHGGARHDPWA